MFQASDSAGKSDTDEYEIREEEYVDVEDMSHRNNHRATEVRGENWQKAVKSDALSGKRRKEGQRGARTVTEKEATRWRAPRPREYVALPEAGPVAVVWFLRRSSLGRTMTRIIRRSQSHPTPATSRLVPIEEEASLEAAKRRHRKMARAEHGGVAKRCAEPIQSRCRWEQREMALRR